MLEEAKKKIGRFYPNDVTGRKGYFGETGEEYIPVGYIWAMRPYQNPACGAEIPLMRWRGRTRRRSLFILTLRVRR